MSWICHVCFIIELKRGTVKIEMSDHTAFTAGIPKFIHSVACIVTVSTENQLVLWFRNLAVHFSTLQVYQNVRELNSFFTFFVFTSTESVENLCETCIVGTRCVVVLLSLWPINQSILS